MTIIRYKKCSAIIAFILAVVHICFSVSAATVDTGLMESITTGQAGNQLDASVFAVDLTLDSIFNRYKNYFLIGNIMEPNQTSNSQITSMFNLHYNLVTAENAMKPQYLSPSKGVYNYTNSNTLIKWAEDNGIAVHGHALVWHSQSAAWLTSGATRADARANMQEYITNVAGHFKGKVISWDVVNEAFDGGRTVPTDWKTVLRVDSPWYIAYENGADKDAGESGADYIYDAFVFARLTDPDAMLFYNDYNETEAWKREAIALMTEDLNAKWETDPRNTEPGRLLIECVGMQSHYWTGDLNIASVEATIVRFIKTGARVAVTELDMPLGTYSNKGSTPLTKEQEIMQANLYARLFMLYKRYAENIERVTFWGKADHQSWRSPGGPLLFNDDFEAKEAYFAVMNPEGYLGLLNGELDVNIESQKSTSTVLFDIKNFTEESKDVILIGAFFDQNDNFISVNWQEESLDMGDYIKREVNVDLPPGFNPNNVVLKGFLWDSQLMPLSEPDLINFLFL